MRDIPLQTRIYSAILTVVTAIVLTDAFVNRRPSMTDHVWQWNTALILAGMIILSEKFEIDFPHATLQFSISVGAILALACGLTLGPFYGALVVLLAELVSDMWLRLKPIQILVNATNLALATFCGAAVYFALCGNAKTPLTDARSMAATVVAATVYTLVNTSILALIIAPVVGDSPVQMWKANFSGSYTLLILPTLGSLVPIIADVNPLGILVLFVPLIGSHFVQKSLQEVKLQTQATMEGLADALEHRDPYTSRHSIRVTDYVRAILQEMPHIPALTQQMIMDAARIHDLGKVGTQDSALQKPGPLTDEERREIQQHSAIGADIVGRLEIYKRSASIVRHHHERWDGGGYPDGLAGEDIPLGARIIGVADAFDAMTSDRPYRRALSPETALSELRKHSGGQFDPTIVEAFERALLKPVPGLEPVLVLSSAD
jgi:HD-GYP domain-containing protein (c-di-GMP phosphodiesterase class II)